MEILNVALTNLGMYNEGTLNFTWLSLPCSDEELAEAFDKIRVSHDDKHYFDKWHCNEYEEYFITDYESDFFNIGEYENIERLNEMAERIAELDESEQEIVKALLDGWCNDLEQCIDKVGDCIVYNDCNDMTDVAYQVCEEQYFDLFNNNDSILSRYFDYEAFGRDLALEGNFIGTDTGYIEVLD